MSRVFAVCCLAGLACLIDLGAEAHETKKIQLIVHNDLSDDSTIDISAVTIVVDYSNAQTALASTKLTLDPEDIPSWHSRRVFDLYLSNADASLEISHVTQMVQWLRPGRSPVEARKFMSTIERFDTSPHYQNFEMFLSEFWRD